MQKDARGNVLGELSKNKTCRSSVSARDVKLLLVPSWVVLCVIASTTLAKYESHYGAGVYWFARNVLDVFTLSMG